MGIQCRTPTACAPLSRQFNIYLSLRSKTLDLQLTQSPQHKPNIAAPPQRLWPNTKNRQPSRTPRGYDPSSSECPTPCPSRPRRGALRQFVAASHRATKSEKVMPRSCAEIADCLSGGLVFRWRMPRTCRLRCRSGSLPLGSRVVDVVGRSRGGSMCVLRGGGFLLGS